MEAGGRASCEDEDLAALRVQMRWNHCTCSACSSLGVSRSHTLSFRSVPPSLQPLMYIHLGLVYRNLVVISGLQAGGGPFQSI